ncbi:SH3 domain-containing protein [Nemania serpens]|nr:SH3 domain-containing protein [Nemania serpens]
MGNARHVHRPRNSDNGLYATRTYNSRSRPCSNTYDANPDSAIDFCASASSLERSGADRKYYNYSLKMNRLVGASPPGCLFVRALYDYEADDWTCLSFHEGDVIQVINQLESGWWDGVLNGVRGWFPSNYCELVTRPGAIAMVRRQSWWVTKEPLCCSIFQVLLRP